MACTADAFQGVREYTYYVGTRALSSILITSPKGHILIDGTVDQAVPEIAAHFSELGFRVKDIRVILNSHVHFDHAGEIAELQRRSGAQVRASPSSARVLKQGHSHPDDPQFGQVRNLIPLTLVQTIGNGETVRVGGLKVVAHFTPGHTPGGTCWTWKSCENRRCLNIVYADSLAAMSKDGFRFSDNSTYPTADQGALARWIETHLDAVRQDIEAD